MYLASANFFIVSDFFLLINEDIQAYLCSLLITEPRFPLRELCSRYQAHYYLQITISLPYQEILIHETDYSS